MKTRGLQGQGMKKNIVYVVFALIAWDALTTYYGTLSIFVGSGEMSVWQKLATADVVKHAVALVFTVALLSFVLCHHIIFKQKNDFTKGIVFTAFAYDFATSFYGTAKAVGVRDGVFSNPSTASGQDVAMVLIVLLLSVMCTSASILLVQILDDGKSAE